MSEGKDQPHYKISHGALLEATSAVCERIARAMEEQDWDALEACGHNLEELARCVTTDGFR